MQGLAEKNGIQLSVGDIKAEELVPVIGDTDGPQPKDIAARLVAHIGHRIPGAKKIEKRLEGKELKAGVLSDLIALGAQLYARNQALLDKAAEDALAQGIGSLTNKMSPPVGGGPIIDFGAVSPETDNNNGGME